MLSDYRSDKAEAEIACTGEIAGFEGCSGVEVPADRGKDSRGVPRHAKEADSMVERSQEEL